MLWILLGNISGAVGTLEKQSYPYISLTAPTARWNFREQKPQHLGLEDLWAILARLSVYSAWLVRAAHGCREGRHGRGGPRQAVLSVYLAYLVRAANEHHENMPALPLAPKAPRQGKPRQGEGSKTTTARQKKKRVERTNLICFLHPAANPAGAPQKKQCAAGTPSHRAGRPCFVHPSGNPASAQQKTMRRRHAITQGEGAKTSHPHGAGGHTDDRTCAWPYGRPHTWPYAQPHGRPWRWLFGWPYGRSCGRPCCANGRTEDHISWTAVYGQPPVRTDGHNAPQDNALRIPSRTALPITPRPTFADPVARTRHVHSCIPRPAELNFRLPPHPRTKFKSEKANATS